MWKTIRATVTIRRLWLLALLALSVMSCERNAPESRTQPAAQGEGTLREEWTGGAAPVPVIGANVDLECDPMPVLAVEPCTYLQSTDAVVWGTVRNVTLATDLMVGSTGPRMSNWEWVTSCEDEGWVEHALRMKVEVSHSFGQELTGTIQVRAGARYVRALDRDVSELQVGQPIGLALHRAEEQGLWSLIGEPMIGLDGDGNIAFGTGINECLDPPVEGLEGASLPEFVDRLSACENSPATSDSSHRRGRIYGEFGAFVYPPGYAAAICHPPADHDHEVPCSTDADCELGLECVYGICEGDGSTPPL